MPLNQYHFTASSTPNVSIASYNPNKDISQIITLLENSDIEVKNARIYKDVIELE